MQSAKHSFTSFIKSKHGFTLIELLIVMAIMAIIGTYTLSNYAEFGEDQKLKNAILDIQSQLKTAQTNATSNVQCSAFSATWQVEFKSDAVTANLNCQNPIPLPTPSPLPTPLNKKTSQLPANVSIQTITGVPSSSCPSGVPFTAYFAPLDGKITIGGNSACTEVTITLTNSRISKTKSLKIEQGGRIYAQ